MLERIHTLLDLCAADAVLITSRHNVGYVSGFWGSFGAVLLTKNENYLFTDFRYREQAQSQAREYNIEIVGGGYYAAVGDILRREEIRYLGIEDEALTLSEYHRLQAQTQSVETVLISDLLSRLRMVKTPREIELIRQAEAIGDQAFQKVLGRIHAGMTEKELENELAYEMKRAGADGFAFASIVVSGAHSSWVHGMPGDNIIRKGDFVLLDFGAIYQNYCGDMTRTVALGAVSDFQREIYAVVQKAQSAALSSLRAGRTCDEIDAIARDIIQGAGYGKNFGHSLGHGVGLLVHERPSLRPGSTDVLEENMVVTVEPGIYLEGKFGVRIEDLVRVTGDGYENLTSSPKELYIL